MRRSAVALTALALLLALPSAALAAGLGGPVRAPLPAPTYDGPTLHPSGKDRYVENGDSGTQGKAAHDPDGDYNYGVDQAGEDGGLYLIDQDGNNGCGNDQDFEDDNNGRCGGVRICAVYVSSSSNFGFIARHPRLVICDDTPDDSSSGDTENTSTGIPGSGTSE